MRGVRRLPGGRLLGGGTASRGGRGGAGVGVSGGGVRGIQRQRVLQLQQLVVRVERRGRTVPALVRRAHYVAPVSEAAHVGRSMIVCVSRAHYALKALRSFGVDVGETARSETGRAVPLLASVRQVILQTKGVSAVQQQTPFAGTNETRWWKK